LTPKGRFHIVSRFARPKMTVMTRNEAAALEFSRPIAADQIGPQETEREISANDAERARLAERFRLLGLDRLTARLQLRRGRAGLVHVQGHFEADVVQACVVTLEPVRAQLREDFTVAFAAVRAVADGEVIIGLDEEDPAEELTDGRIDLGEVVAQQLAVALDPYPRVPGADDRFEQSDQQEPAAKGGNTPFAALEGLRPRRN
jgi:uncharacterized metal-binding protein YceD (DUF177 family)